MQDAFTIVALDTALKINNKDSNEYLTDPLQMAFHCQSYNT